MFGFLAGLLDEPRWARAGQSGSRERLATEAIGRVNPFTHTGDPKFCGSAYSENLRKGDEFLSFLENEKYSFVDCPQSLSKTV